MNKSVFTLILLALMGLATGCGPKEMTPEEIYNKEASGVVLVLNQFYYSAELSDGTNIYFSDFKDGKLEDVSFNEDSIVSSMAFGTAFFIGSDGSLLTNQHVVAPDIPRSEVKRYIQDFIRSYKEDWENSQKQLKHRYDSLQQEINDDTHSFLGYTYESDENVERRAQQDSLEKRYFRIDSLIDVLETIDLNAIKITTHSKVSIAYHDSYVTSPEDFQPCVVIKTSSENEADLALIRLKDKKTPSKAHIFTMPKDEGNMLGPSQEERETLTLNQQLVLIGYNQGVELAATREGIKAQLTTGNVSQQPDEDRVMYTIPVLNGSSGSPVLNLWGELVAVNFAGAEGKQGFNFGIPLKQIRKFLEQ